MSTKPLTSRKTSASSTPDEPSFRDLMEQTDPNCADDIRHRPAPPPPPRFVVPYKTIGSSIDVGEIKDEFRRDGLQHREMHQLKKGKFHVSDRECIDLHGLKRDDACQALEEFLARCLHRGSRYALVICGKGHHSPHGKAVLKSLIRGWLMECREVLAYCPALRKDGGDGALYVLLSKRHGGSSKRGRQ